MITEAGPIMMKMMTRMVPGALLMVGLLTSQLAVAAGGGQLDYASIDLENKASLQNGAKLYVNYCMGCHSLQYMRYNRMAEDLGLTEEQLQAFLIPGDAKPGDLMTIAMTEGDATSWLGVAPPDLSLIARRKAGGANWTYTFLRSFYADPSQSTGWNNSLMPGTSMPNVLWQLQGIQAKVVDDGHAGDDDHGDGHSAGPTFELAQSGSMSPAQYDAAINDLVTFLDYVGEPAKLKRLKIGVWVFLYLSLFTTLAYFLKREFWKDIH